MIYNDIIAAIGHTPTVRLAVPRAPEAEVYAKLELQNLFAMKDRVAKQMVTQAKQEWSLKPGAPIVESSSGTMALGLALVGTRLGHPVHIVTDPRIDPITLAKLRALGCHIYIVKKMTSGGWQKARLQMLHHVMDELDGAFWPQQYSNPQNPLAYTALADELLAEVGEFDVLVGAVGSGGSLCGTARALQARLPRLQTIAVDCVGSVLFGQRDWPQRKQSGLGNSLYPANLDYSLINEVHWLNDTEAFQATRDLAREQGIFAGNTSGSVYRVMSHLARRAGSGTKMVGIFPDRGDRYIESVFQGDEAGPVGEPTEVPYGAEADSWSYARLSPREARDRLVFVESNTTGSGIAALWTAYRLGMEPVLLTNDPDRYSGLSATPARVVECPTNEPGAVSDAVAAEAHSGLLAGVTTTSEFYVVAAARAARAQGLPTTPPEAAETCRNKATMRRALAAAGVSQPAFAAVRDLDGLAGALSVVGSPCVVKPVDDTGSFNVRLCRTLEEAYEHASHVMSFSKNVRGQQAARGILVEAYLDAPEYSIEILAKDAEYTCLGVTRKSVGHLPYFVETEHRFPAGGSPSALAAVAAEAQSALRACGFTQGIAHVEVKQTSAGPAVVEVNPRPAGGMIPELMRLAGAVDPVELQIRLSVGMPFAEVSTPGRHSGIRFLTAPKEGTVIQITGADAARHLDGVDQVVVTADVGQRVRRARSAYDRLGHVVAVASSDAEVREMLVKAVDMISIDIAEDRSDLG